MSPPIVSVGIVGAGAAARLHLRALRRIKGVRIVGIRDLHPEKVARLAAEFGLPSTVVEPGDLYARGPRSIHVATPPNCHQELAFEALQHGCHVMVEKPPALTLAGCEMLVAEAAARHLSIGVNENTAWEPLIRRAGAIIERGRLGRVLQIDGHYAYGWRDTERRASWLADLPGGLLEDLLPHLLTTARALAGCRLVPEYWRVAKTGAIPGPQDDELRLLLSGDGLAVNLSLSLAARPKAFGLVVRGTRATLVADLRHLLLQVHVAPSWGAVAIGGELVRSALHVLWRTAANAAGIAAGYREPHGSFLPLMRAHYTALAAGTELPAPLARATETIAIVRKIWPSADAD